MSTPIIPTGWILAMITCGGLGFLAHIGFAVSTIRYYKSEELDSMKGKIFIIACILVYVFNGFACFEWLFLRTDIIIDLNRTICSAIYSSNFMSYFLGKYFLHYLYIYRIYVTFRGSHCEMSRCHLYTFLIIMTINFFVSIAFWTYNVAPSVLEGIWYLNGDVFRICTLFSESATNTLSVKAAAISIGLEDLIIGSITLYSFLKRFHLISTQISDDVQLLQFSIKFAVVASFSVISTLFLFTLAIPFYPDFTFILAIDASINSLCLFCMLSIGSNVYNYLFYPCHRCAAKYVTYKMNSKQMSKSMTHMTTTTTNRMPVPRDVDISIQTRVDNEHAEKASLPTLIGQKLSNSFNKHKKQSLLTTDLATVKAFAVDNVSTEEVDEKTPAFSLSLGTTQGRSMPTPSVVAKKLKLSRLHSLPLTNRHLRSWQSKKIQLKDVDMVVQGKIQITSNSNQAGE